MAGSATMTRRNLMKLGLVSTGLSLVSKGFVSSASAQVGGRAEEELYEGKNLPGGAQTDPRVTVSPYNGDPDIVEVAERMSPFNPESWHVEWTRVAEKNEKVAEEFEKEGAKVSAHEYYLRAAQFYSRAVTYLPETDARMIPTFNKLREMHKRAGQLVPPSYETVEIPYEGSTLTAYFSRPRGAAGQRFPTVYAYGGADSVTVSGGGGAYTARGMAYLAVDGPGQGASLRIKRLYAPPDSERVAKVVVDYLVSRPDVDPNRIGITGSSMGGYSAPRCVTAEKRLKACSVWSGAYSLLEDIFDFFPAIQERLRWLIGAKDLVEARKKIAEFTLEGRAQRIECPMLIGYGKDDRIMDPQGALRLYQAAVNSKREMLEGIAHDSGRMRPRLRTKAPRDILMADWMARHLVGGMSA